MGNMNFENLGLCSEIQKAVKYMGFEEASPIQAKAIPVILDICMELKCFQSMEGRRL